MGLLVLLFEFSSPSTSSIKDRISSSIKSLIPSIACYHLSRILYNSEKRLYTQLVMESYDNRARKIREWRVMTIENSRKHQTLRHDDHQHRKHGHSCRNRRKMSCPEVHYIYTYIWSKCKKKQTRARPKIFLQD